MAEIEEKLLNAITSGDLNILKESIEAGANINSYIDFKTWIGVTPIFLACVSRQFAIADYLITKGADVFIVSIDGFLPVTLLPEKDMINYVTTKMKHLNEPDENGDTPFARVVERDNFYAVKFLVEKMNANVCRKALTRGDPPLVKATKNNNLSMVKYLVDHGAVPSMDVALECALDMGFLDIVQYFIKKPINLNQKFSDGNTLLTKAVKHRYEDIIDLLIKQGANFGLNNSDGQSALNMSIDLNFHSITSKFIRNGANVNTVDKDGKTAFIKIIENGDYVMFKEAIEAGAKIDRIDKNGMNALNLAASKGDLLMTIFLIEYSPDCLINTAKMDIEKFAMYDRSFAKYWQKYQEKSCASARNFMECSFDKNDGQE